MTSVIIVSIVSAICLLAAGIFIGILLFPYILHQRASRTDGLIDGKPFDKSNRANTINVIAHYGTHPEDFGIMQYPGGKKPFPYLTEDLLSDTLDTRPNSLT